MGEQPVPDAPGSRPYATPDQLAQRQEDSAVKHYELVGGISSPHLYRQPEIGPSTFISDEYLADLYAVLVPPPLTALAAFATRLPHAKLTADLAHTTLVELCCIHPSFWDAVDAAQPMPTDRQGPYTNFWDETRGSNADLATLGDSLLRLFTAEYLETKYPHLPELSMRYALNVYAGAATCADIARMWGVHAGQTSAPRPTSNEALAYERRNRHGRTAGQGLLRWRRTTPAAADSDKPADRPSDPSRATPFAMTVGPFTEAMASVSRAIVGAVFLEHGNYDQVRRFVHANWLSRKADLFSLLKWQKPRMVLMNTLIKYKMPPSVTRLLKESGRDSHMPLYVVGIFSGDNKMGEGYGSSIRMAEFRAAEDALRRIYMTRTFASTEGVPDLHATPSLPSETLLEEGEPYVPQPIGDDEVEYGRARLAFLSEEQQTASPFREGFQPPARIERGPRPKLTGSERRATRPLEGPGSADPSLPLEHRLPRYMWQRMAGGPRGRREKGNNRPVRQVPDKVTSPYFGPFDQEALSLLRLSQAREVRSANDYPTPEQQKMQQQMEQQARTADR